MAEQEVETTESEETTDSIWKKLGITDPDEAYAAEEEVADGEAEKDDKAARKLDKRVDDLEKKFRQDKLQEAKDKFLENCDPLEADLFKVIAADAKDPEAIFHAIELVQDRAAKVKETVAAAEADATDQLRKSYGVANPGRAAQPTDDEEKAMKDAIAAGDTKAGFAAIMGDDDFLKGRV